MNDEPQKKKGLTYGRAMLIMLALIFLAVGAAAVRQRFLGSEALGFKDVGFAVVKAADYVETQVDSPTLQRFKTATPKSLGTLLFVRTGEGNYAKLIVDFSFDLLDPQNIKFKIHQGQVLSPQGEVILDLSARALDLSLRFDLDSGQYEGQGAPIGSADLYFIQRGPGLQIVRALPPAFLALPKTSDLHP